MAVEEWEPDGFAVPVEDGEDDDVEVPEDDEDDVGESLAEPPEPGDAKPMIKLAETKMENTILTLTDPFLVEVKDGIDILQEYIPQDPLCCPKCLVPDDVTAAA